MVIELVLDCRTGVQQVESFTSIELVRLAAGYPTLPGGSDHAMYEMLFLLTISLTYLPALTHD